MRFRLGDRRCRWCVGRGRLSREGHPIDRSALISFLPIVRWKTVFIPYYKSQKFMHMAEFFVGLFLLCLIFDSKRWYVENRPCPGQCIDPHLIPTEKYMLISHRERECSRPAFATRRRCSISMSDWRADSSCESTRRFCWSPHSSESCVLMNSTQRLMLVRRWLRFCRCFASRSSRLFESFIIVFDAEFRNPTFELGVTKAFLEQRVNVDCVFEVFRSIQVTSSPS